MENNWYLYRHRRLDNNKIFYVGIGKTLRFKRAFSKASRSEYWHNIINKTEYTIEIIAEKLLWEDVQELEAFLILNYGRKDLGLGSLVNMTDGYGGVNNPSEETREKMSKGQKGKISVWRGKELPESTKKLMRENHANFSGSNHPKAKKVINTQTKEIFGSVRDVVEIVNMNHRTICAKLNGGKYKNNTGFVWFDKYNENIEYKLENVKINKRKIIDTNTGKIYNTAKEAALSFNINYSTLYNYLTERVTPNRTTLMYYNENQ